MLRTASKDAYGSNSFETHPLSIRSLCRLYFTTGSIVLALVKESRAGQSIFGVVGSNGRVCKNTLLSDGGSIAGVYPPDEETLAEYAAWRETKKEHEPSE
jgi:hypothetical protein